MKKTLLFNSLLALTILSSVGCKSGSTSSNYMSFEEVSYVTEFPRTVNLDSAEKIDLNMVGMQDIAIQDSLLIVSTPSNDGCWAIYSLPEFTPKGRYLLKGNGPEEFLFPPWVGSASFRDEDDALCAYIADNSKGRMFRMNVSRSVENQKLDIRVVNDSLPPLLFVTVYIDSTTYLFRTITDDQSQQLRFFRRNGQDETPPFLEVLNRAKVRANTGDHNILSALIRYSASNNKLVEMPVALNNINIYAPDGSFARTVCIGRKLDNVDDIQKIEFFDRPYTYASLRIYDDFFGVLYMGETDKSFELGRTKLPKIQLFDWQGEPLLEIELKHQATGFDFDLKNGYLYTIDHQTEELYKYPVGELLPLVK